MIILTLCSGKSIDNHRRCGIFYEPFFNGSTISSDKPRISIRPVCNDKTVLRKSKINLSFPASDYKSSEEGIEKDDDLFLNPKSSQNQKITLDPGIVKNYSLVVESDGKRPNSAGAERNVIVDDPGNGFIDDMFLTAMRELGYLDDDQDSISINSYKITTGNILNNNYSDCNRTEFKCISSKYTINNHKFEFMLVVICIALFTILPSIFTYIIMKKLM